MPNIHYKYKGALAIMAAFMTVAVLLECFNGPVEWGEASWIVMPSGIKYWVGVLIFLYYFQWKWKIIRTFASAEMAVVTLSVLAVLTVVMGLTPQTDTAFATQHYMGFDRMLRFWPFVMAFFMLFMQLCLLSINQIRAWNKRKLASTLCHVGMALFMMGSINNVAAGKKCLVYCEADKEQRTGLTDDHKVVELPFSVRLNSFEIVENPLQYRSHVVLAKYEHMKQQAVIWVNHPADYEGWTLYQSSYGTHPGQTEPYSVLLAVHDPGSWPRQTGLLMILTGAVALVFSSGKRKRK